MVGTALRTLISGAASTSRSNLHHPSRALKLSGRFFISQRAPHHGGALSLSHQEDNVSDLRNLTAVEIEILARLGVTETDLTGEPDDE